jgi:hypothetical protein
LRQRGRLFPRAVIYRGRLTLRNIWGTRSLGARTSGPHEALPYLEEMRTGGPSVPRRAGRYSILTGAEAQEESPILTACYTPNQSKNLTSTPLRYRGKGEDGIRGVEGGWKNFFEKIKFESYDALLDLVGHRNSRDNLLKLLHRRILQIL